MKQLKSLIIAIILFSSLNIHAQDITMAQRWIKAGNSLREAHQYDQGEDYLVKGMKLAKSLKNGYWEAVASEYLALLYVNTEDMTSATQYFNNALRLYESQRLSLSAKVIKDLMTDNNITSDQVWQFYGGVEVGSKGVKYSIIKARRREGHLSFVSVRDGSRNTQIIDFTPAAISETSEAVKTFVETISQSPEKISPENIFIAVSSGVKQEADKVAGREDQLRQALKTAVPSYTKPIEFLSACKEGDLTIKGVVPNAFLYASSLMDIGSGNTKGGYRRKGESIAECLSIPWGTSTLSKKIAGKDPAFANQFYQDSVGPVINGEFARKSGITNRQIAYYSGGIFWAMCNYIHPEKIKDDFTEFTKQDVEKFLKDATTNYDALINPDVTRISDMDGLQEAQKVITRTRETFNKDNIIAGALIVKGLINEMEKTGAKNKRYIFARFGYVGWISGYIVNKVDSEFIGTKD